MHEIKSFEEFDLLKREENPKFVKILQHCKLPSVHRLGE